jgi:uncharacterized SAM-binding protein YcdF (DUF218 family)
MKYKPLIFICAASALVFFIFSALFGVTFGIIFIIGNILFSAFLYYSYPLTRNKVWRSIRRVLLAGYGLFLVSFAAVQILLLIEMGNEAPENTDYAVILGAGLKGKEISKTLENRLEAGLDYLQENPDTQVIVSGGQGEGEDIPESTAMSRYLVSHGISAERITEESRSKTTFENLRNSKRILEKKGAADSAVLIITSDYHVFRAKLTAEKLGMDCTGIGGESDFFIKINYMIREYFGVVKAVVFDEESAGS